MPTISDITEGILDREGGFVNDPNDPGGATNHGVTIGTMRRLGIDIDGDGDIDIDDVRALPRERAGEIFERHYYHATGIAALPAALQPSVYDMQVNSGGNAVRILQRLLCDMGIEVSVDGAIGPETIGATQEAYDMAGDYLVDAYGIARRNFYYGLADRRPASRRYARRRDGGKGGWIVRAEEFISPEFHLSDAEHRARVAAWG
jgi:lysozyme family protein